jgi:dihydroorotate dehydrogenase (NAD+) catalytic subunit
MGGISCWQDAVEFILAGASAIQIGAYNFIDPTVSVKVADGILAYLERHNIKNVKELVGEIS